MSTGAPPPWPQRSPVSYAHRLERRALTAVDLVVVHCTELPDLATARTYAEQILYPGSGTGNCGHYYVGPDGAVLEWVEPKRIAHHCVGVNARAIGIELDHPGRWPDWLHSAHQAIDRPYPEAQISGLLHLLTQILKPLLPQLRYVAGHQELDRRQVPATDDPGRTVYRKRDPGESFPWAQVEAATRHWLIHTLPPDVAPLT